MKELHLFRFGLRSSAISLLNAFLSSILFIFLDDVLFMVTIPGGNLNDLIIVNSIWLFLYVLANISMITEIPALIGGFLLALFLLKEVNRKRFSVKRGTLEGGIIGLLAGLICIGIIFVVTLCKPRLAMTTSGFLLHSLSAIIVSTLAGTWTGWTSSRYIQRKTDHPDMS